LKVCSHCKIEKEESEFSKSKRTKDNLDSWCKQCWKVYRTTYRDKNNNHSKVWREANKEYFRTYRKEWYEKNQQKWTEYVRIKRATDDQFRLKINLRTRVWHALNGSSKSKATFELLDCTSDQLKAHLESLFKEGMSWNNYGKNGWEVDHIRPCASFDLTDLEQQKQCFHYSNLQPLWRKENRAKSDKLCNNTSIY